jgi:protein TonB
MKFFVFVFFAFFTVSVFAQSKTESSAAKSNASKDNNQVFVVVEEMPVFNYSNCTNMQDCFKNFVTDNISSLSIKCKGKAYIEFIVEKDGVIDNAKFVRELSNCTDYKEKLLKLVESMPKWSPGKQNKIPVRVAVTMPVELNGKL